MHPFDWFVIVAYFGWILWGGLRKARNTSEVEGYFLANRSLPWWAVGVFLFSPKGWDSVARGNAPGGRSCSLPG